MADRAVLRVVLGAEDYSKLRQEEKGGEYNLQLVTRSLNSIKPMTNKAARVILYQADTALDKAKAKVSTILPGKTAPEEMVTKRYNEVSSHLNWHREHIAPESSKDNDTFYDHAEDLRKWAIEAFITYNMATEGQKTENQRSFYKEAVTAFANLIDTGKKAVSKTTNYVAWGIGIAAAAAGAYGWYQLKMAKIKSTSRNPFGDF